MLQLRPNEQVLLIMRRHWFAFAAPVIVFVVLLTVPPLMLSLAPFFFPLLRLAAAAPIANFLLALYLLGLLAYFLVLWIEYYLDVWIITSDRIIDIEQHGLFHREVSEIAMDRIQNVTIEIPGLVATLLRFGNIKIQTAGETTFTITEVPDCYRAKEFILEYSRRTHRQKAGELPSRDGQPEL